MLFRSVRCLTGILGPQNKVVGYRDTNQSSNGGFGGGTYNHWFRINLTAPAWIILVKGPPRPQYIQLEVYELDQTPIQARPILQADTINATANNGNTYQPFDRHVANSQSYLYNNSDLARIDQGNNMYFPLGAGGYLLCISSTRNEPLDYSVGIIVEFADLAPLLALEAGIGDLLTFENNDNILLDITPNYSQQDEHEHSLSEWVSAWQRDHQHDDAFPSFLSSIPTLP